MTLEEAIEHAKQVAGNETTCLECRNEHEQLAAWLLELKDLRKKVSVVSHEKRNSQR